MAFVFARGQHVTLSHLACKLPLGCHLSCAEDACHSSTIQGCGTRVPSVSSCLLPLLQWQMLGWGTHWEPRICYYQFGRDSDPSPSGRYKNIGDVCLWVESTISLLPPNPSSFYAMKPTSVWLLALSWCDNLMDSDCPLSFPFPTFSEEVFADFLFNKEQN